MADHHSSAETIDQHASAEANEQIDLDGDDDIEDMMDDKDSTDYDGYNEQDPVGSVSYKIINDGHEEQEHGHSFEESDMATKAQRHEEKTNESKDESDIRKHTELLSLPPHSSEVFIGGLPRDATENELSELCEQFGEVFEVKLVKDKETRESKGFAFVTFTTKDAAQEAIEVIHNKEFKGKTLRCSLSQVKYKLFIGNVPKYLTEDNFRKILEDTGPGVENIECYKDPQNPGRNRGFIFVEYYNHECAEYAKQKMSNSDFKIEGLHPGISWADPRNIADASAAAQVKVIYVKNLPVGVTSEKLKTLFERHGEVTKVVLPPSKSGLNKREFGFVHFAERSSALNAVKSADKYEIDGQVIDAVLAKPQTPKKSHKYPQYPSHGYPGAYNSGYNAGGHEQPVIYGRGPMPSGMAMVPIALPDGRIGFVLQQPGALAPLTPPHSSHRDVPDRAGERNRGHRYHGSGHASDGADRGGGRSQGRRYYPY